LEAGGVFDDGLERGAAFAFEAAADGGFGGVGLRASWARVAVSVAVAPIASSSTAATEVTI
jgi:hypothetical protein